MHICIDEKDLKDRVSCIYKITNTKNGKIYIGQTRDIRKRSSDYRNAHKKEIRHGMYQKIYEEGTDNFKLEILEKSDDDSKLTERENYYITTLEATNPEKGYNKMIPVSPMKESTFCRSLKSLAHKGLKESAVTKRKKSKPIIAVKDDILIVSDSAKLFGDYIDKSRDIIKNGLRDPTSILGYNIYYDNPIYRIRIKKKVFKKKSIRNTNYLKYLEIIDHCEIEGVETISDYFKVYQLSYDYIDSEGKPILKEWCTA